MSWWPFYRKRKCPLTIEEIDKLGRLFVWIEHMPTSATINKDEAVFMVRMFEKLGDSKLIEWRRE